MNQQGNKAGQRERLASRLGFILLSAGCAIGCGNVWKFPWMCGTYGGGGFVVIRDLPDYQREYFRKRWYKV